MKRTFKKEEVVSYVLTLDSEQAELVKVAAEMMHAACDARAPAGASRPRMVGDRHRSGAGQRQDAHPGRHPAGGVLGAACGGRAECRALSG